MVSSIHRHGDRVLDIGCGHGFDGDADLQKSIAEESGWFVGVEPDAEIEIPTSFSESHRTILEDAPLEKHSIDVAYSVFVLEHVKCAQGSWQARLLTLFLDPRRLSESASARTLGLLGCFVPSPRGEDIGADFDEDSLSGICSRCSRGETRSRF